MSSTSRMSGHDTSYCPHVGCVGVNTWEDVAKIRQTHAACDECGAVGPNLWLCLQSRCLYVGCGESTQDHSMLHSEGEKHNLTMNMTNMRIWCHLCECEVYMERNMPPFVMRETNRPHPAPPSEPCTPERRVSQSAGQSVEDSESDDDSETSKPRGLTGLENVGNTCYLNSAVQALSNCPPLTRFFLDCPGFMCTNKKPMLSHSYMKLMSEMWHRRRLSYVVPSSVVHGIKQVHPMFSGYTQQDAQEFLRCFMDQIHEELKYPVATSSENCDDSASRLCSHGDSGIVAASTACDAAPESDTDYETCDSGLSSEQGSEEHSASDADERKEAIDAEPAHHQADIETASADSADDDDTVKDGGAAEINRCEDSGIGVSSSTSQHGATTKDMKESVNQASRQATHVTGTQSSPAIPGSGAATDDAPRTDTDAAEYSDAICDVEPVHQAHKARVQKSRSNPETEKSPRPPPPTVALETETCGATTQRSGQTAHRAEGKKMSRYKSVISEVFDGRILSSVQCLTCERVSSTKETFQDLSLPILGKDHLYMLHASAATHKAPCTDTTQQHNGWMTWMWRWMRSWLWGPTITLQDCLAAFFSADELKGDNMYSCEKCNKLRNGMKYSRVIDLPEILCIHLKRFRHDFVFSSKIGSYVSFPLDGLDMGPYLHKECKNQVTMYDLVSVICHHGTAGGGHYTAYGLNYVSDQWYEFDDKYVTEVDRQQVENCEAYVLFYRKQNDAMIPLRQKAEDIMLCPSDSFMNFYISKQWINKFNTFAEPGPISNDDFLCRHRGVLPYRWPYVKHLVQEVPQKLWEFLHDEFGGGPAINHLYLCTTCQGELERLKCRQKYEMDKFVQLNEEFQKGENPAGPIYAISMSWFKDWENFVRARTNDVPGPIDNNSIAVTKSGCHQVSLKVNSDYGQLSEETWQFLFSIYGGGPLVKQTRSPPATLVANDATATEACDSC